MSKNTQIRVWISCLCFLALIYGLASLDQAHRKAIGSEVPTMAKTDTQAPQLAEEKIMYLTFDDGPSLYTQDVLDILGKYSIKATFFVTGENPDYAFMLKKIKEDGHTLGIHTYSHDYSKIYANEEAYFEDVDKVAALIKKETGDEVQILRFPGGSSNTVSRNYQTGIMSTLSESVKKKGYQYYDWNAHNGDGDPSISPSSLYEQAMREIKGKNEVMMLMHDGSANKNTISSLDDVLKAMIQQGWTFKTIEESNTPIFQHHIAN